MRSSILIDTNGEKETRILVLEGREIQEYKQEAFNSNRLAGNIYLARIDKIEPSIQAAFVDLGIGRHGFLPFRAIHPDYYNLPENSVDAQDSKTVDKTNGMGHESANCYLKDFDDFTHDLSSIGFPSSLEQGGNGDKNYSFNERDNENGHGAPVSRVDPNDYLIQEVIEKGQVVLVQVSRDEFHAKGAALTTYVSLPSKYCVFLPNSRKGFSISNKIESREIREELKKTFERLDFPSGAGLIMRTINSIPPEGAIENDFRRLRQVWLNIAEKAQSTTAPTLLQKEGDVIERTLRDYFRDGLDEIIVEGDWGYERAREVVGSLAPSELTKVQKHTRNRPLFVEWGAYEELRMLHQPIVQLKSGGHLVIETTEALVSIDVNSAKSNQSSSLSETALRTNLEAAEEIARQLRLRDLAGIIVIDFIDMESWQHRKEVQDTFRSALKRDQAWINTNPISKIGLLEMTRQRTGEDLVGNTTTRCPACDGTGRILLDETVALNILRHVEAECSFRRVGNVIIFVSNQVSQHLLNEHRKEISRIEDNYGCRIRFEVKFGWYPRDYAFQVYNADREKLTFKFDSRQHLNSLASGSQQGRAKRKSRNQTRNSGSAYNGGQRQPPRGHAETSSPRPAGASLAAARSSNGKGANGSDLPPESVKGPLPEPSQASRGDSSPNNAAKASDQAAPNRRKANKKKPNSPVGAADKKGRTKSRPPSADKKSDSGRHPTKQKKVAALDKPDVVTEATATDTDVLPPPAPGETSSHQESDPESQKNAVKAEAPVRKNRKEKSGNGKSPKRSGPSSPSVSSGPEIEVSRLDSESKGLLTDSKENVSLGVLGK